MNLFTDDTCLRHHPPAEFSPCRTWRYVLRRRWASGKVCGWILLNPSTADETQDDPTIRRCIGYSKAWGFGGLVLGNIFALRSTDPKALYAHVAPRGPENAAALVRIAEEAGGAVVCGWGAHGALMNYGNRTRSHLRDKGVKLQALALTKDGEPGHPLYLAAALKPFELKP